MSEEKIEYKVSVPLFEKGELETFDNHIHEIVEEYSKLVLKEKEQILTQRIIMKQEEEIERLNNIINESNKMIDKIVEEVYKPVDKEWDNILCIIEDYKLKLQELKGSDK